MSRFSFLGVSGIDALDVYDKREVLIKDFLLERSINIIWGRAGLGKTWLCFGVGRYLVESGKYVVYIDSDNGADTIKDRNFDKHIKEMGERFVYVNGDMMDDSKKEMVELFDKIEANAVNGYEGCIFILDSLTFFLSGGIYDEGKIDKIVTWCKKIRKAGGTVIIINHATKKGDGMRGGGTLINALDEVFEVEKISEVNNTICYKIKPEKKRMKVCECAYGVCTKTLALRELDSLIAGMSDEEREFCEAVKDKLKDGEMSQNELLSGLGYNTNSKLKIASLEKFVGKFWNVKKGKRNSKIYKIIRDS